MQLAPHKQKMSTQTIHIGGSSTFPNSATTINNNSNGGYVSNVTVITTATGMVNANANNRLPAKSQSASIGNYTIVRKKQRLNPATPLGESNMNTIANAVNTLTANQMMMNSGLANNNFVVRKVPGQKRARVTHQTAPIVLLSNNGENVAPQTVTATTSLLNRPKGQHSIKHHSTIASSGGTASMPPVSVARRNARERNRVKQVNNGFTALRDRIPDEVAEIFEAHGTGRGSVKKLSKVETLRMAVEYIRSLEQCLVDDGVVLPTPPMDDDDAVQEAVDDEDTFDFSGHDFNGNSTIRIMSNTTGDDDLDDDVDSATLMLDEEATDALGSATMITTAACAPIDVSAFLDTSSSTGSTISNGGSTMLTNNTQEFIRLPAGGTFQISTPIYERDENGVGLLQHQYAGVPILDASTGFIHHPQQRQPQQKHVLPQQHQQQQQRLQVQLHHQQQQHAQQQLQQFQQLQLQQNVMLMSPAASISPNSYTTEPSPSPASVTSSLSGGAGSNNGPIKTEECYVILPPAHLRGEQQQALLQQQLQQQQQRRRRSPIGTTIQMAADGTVYYATMAPEEDEDDDDVNENGGNEVLMERLQQQQHQQLLDGDEDVSLSPVPAMYALKTELSDDSDELLLCDQDQWWQPSSVAGGSDEQQQEQVQPLQHLLEARAP